MSRRRGYPAAFYANMNKNQRKAVKREIKWLDDYNARQARKQAKAQAKAQHARWWANNGRVVRNVLRIIVLLVAVSLLAFVLFHAPSLLVWAWNGGIRRILPHASVLSLSNAWQVLVACAMCGAVIVFAVIYTWRFAVWRADRYQRKHQQQHP